MCYLQVHGSKPAGTTTSGGRRGVADWSVVVSAVIAALACIVILAFTGLGFYALHKIRPGWFRLQAGAGQRVTFTIEMGQGGDPAPHAERRELEAGHDKPRELEAGPGGLQPPGAADNAAA
jgi:hypothetical protein